MPLEAGLSVTRIHNLYGLLTLVCFTMEQFFYEYFNKKPSFHGSVVIFWEMNFKYTKLYSYKTYLTTAPSKPWKISRWLK